MFIFWVFKDCTDKIGLLIECGLSEVKSYSRIFDLSGCKNRFALRWEKPGKSRFGGDD